MHTVHTYRHTYRLDTQLSEGQYLVNLAKFHPSLRGTHFLDFAGVALSAEDGVDKERRRERDLRARATIWPALAPAPCLPALAYPGPQPAFTPAVLSSTLPQPPCPPSLPPFLPCVSLLYHSISLSADSLSPCLAPLLSRSSAFPQAFLHPPPLSLSPFASSLPIHRSSLRPWPRPMLSFI